MEKDLENLLKKHFRMTFPAGDIYKFTSPNRRFVPDQFLDTGRVLAFVEMKANNSAPIHPGQIREILRMRKRGRIADILWSEDQIKRFITTMGIVHEERYDFTTDSQMFKKVGAYNFNVREEDYLGGTPRD